MSNKWFSTVVYFGFVYLGVHSGYLEVNLTQIPYNYIAEMVINGSTQSVVVSVIAMNLVIIVA